MDLSDHLGSGLGFPGQVFALFPFFMGSLCRQWQRWRLLGSCRQLLNFHLTIVFWARNISGQSECDWVATEAENYFHHNLKLLMSAAALWWPERVAAGGSLLVGGCRLVVGSAQSQAVPEIEKSSRTHRVSSPGWTHREVRSQTFARQTKWQWNNKIMLADLWRGPAREVIAAAAGGWSFESHLPRPRRGVWEEDRGGSGRESTIDTRIIATWWCC